MLQAATKLAVKYHSGQFRKNDAANGVALPYVSHPFDVMKTLWNFSVFNEEVLAAALLHDTLEDTAITPEEIRSISEKVFNIVEELTFRLPAGTPKNQAKAGYLASFKFKSVEALVIKVVDRFCNVADFYDMMDVIYAQKYFRKAEDLFEAFELRKEEIIALFGKTTYNGIYYKLKEWEAGFKIKFR